MNGARASYIRTKRVLAIVWFGFAAAASSSHDGVISTGGYLEAGACTQCHGEIAKSYSQSGMARSFGAVRSVNSFSDIKAGTFYHPASEEFFTLYSRDGRPYLKRHQIGFDGSTVNNLEMQIDYWFGSGNNARSYISRTKAGELVQLPVTWYAEKGGYWAMSPGYDRPDHAGFSREITYRCMFCHNGYPDLPSPANASFGETRFPNTLPGGIDCQRCHGPGQPHVDAAVHGYPLEEVRSAIVNPARLSTDRQMEVCMQCHLETTSLKLPASLLRYGRGVFSYRPGEPLSNYILHFDRSTDDGSGDRIEFVSAAYRLRKSSCYLRSGGRLTCTTCHNPHEPAAAAGAARRYDRACLSCHQTESPALVARHRNSALQECASCHMPRRRPSDAIHVMVTDHLIQRPASRREPVVEKNDSNTPPYRGRVALYYPERSDDPEIELYLAVAQVTHEANLEQGKRQLEALLVRLSPSRAEFYFELAEAYRRSGDLEKARSLYEQAGSHMPADWRPFYQLGKIFSVVGNMGRAMSGLERASVLAPRETAVHEAIAALLSHQGKQNQAVSTLRAALEIDPESANLYSNLGVRLLQAGDVNGAERAWREALRLRPESATTRLNLANLISTLGGFDEARYHFKAAIRTAPSLAEAHFSYAAALAAHGETSEAEREFRETIKYAPNHFESHLRLGQILKAQGDNEQAAHHLKKAAESPDTRIRGLAKEQLRSN